MTLVLHLVNLQWRMWWRRDQLEPHAPRSEALGHMRLCDPDKPPNLSVLGCPRESSGNNSSMDECVPLCLANSNCLVSID